MSVINEMLKDLEKRKAPQDESASNYVSSVSQANSPSYKLLIILIAITAIISVAATYFIQNVFTEDSDSAPSQQIVEHNETQVPEQQGPTKVLDNTLVNQPGSQKSESKPEVTRIKPAFVEPKIEKVITQPVISKSSKPVNKVVIAEPNSRVEALAISPIALPVQSKVATRSDQQLVISKVELSPKQLSLKKLNQAKRYLNDNELSKAQVWLEEAIILDPYNVEARKQLAAVWYGGKSYRQAINLLSQGLSLSPNNEEYRLMLARLYSIIGSDDKAFAVLNELAQSKLLEYQIALANMAAQTEHHIEAVSAYQKLLAMRPNEGRWWLGMAISLDTSEQYGQAIVAYKEAIMSNKLSKNSKKFAEQRLVELGE